MVREEPDRQDEAQALINDIVKSRNEYNLGYESLITLLYQQQDENSALKVISQLETLDKNPNKQTQDDISQAKRTARLVANNKRYNDIMRRALAQLNARNYAAAVTIYLEGSDLARDMFDESGFGNVVTNQVDRAWADLKAAAGLFVTAEAALKQLPAQGSAVLAANGPAAAFDPLLAQVQALAGWRQRAWADARLFKAQNAFLIKNGRQEDFHLGYSALLVQGPADAKDQQGILGAVDRLWDEVLTPWTAAIRTTVEARYAAAQSTLKDGRYDEALAAFEGLRAAARRGLDALTLWNRIAGIDETGAWDPTLRPRLAQNLPVALWLDHRLNLAVQGLKAAADLPRAAGLAARTDLDRPGLEGARGDVRTQRQTFAANAASALSWSAQSQALSAQGYNLLDAPGFGTQWQATWEGYRQKALAQESDFVNRRGSLDYSLLDQRFQSLQSTLTEVRTQVEGKVKFSLQASARLTDLRPLQDRLGQDITDFAALYDGESPEVKTAPVLTWPVRGRDLLARLNAAQTLQGQLLATAKGNFAQSQLLKQQGSGLIPQIPTLVSAENFTQARTVLNQVSTAFSQSLALQEDAAFRAESDAQVKALFDQILKAENEVVIREVRKLITQGSQLYLGQNFTQAEQVLLRARTRWSATNTDPNTEVEYWLTLASYALSVTTGRELSPIDPLYNEVQTLLNVARRNFTLGQDQLGAGKKDEGLALMKQAKDVLGKVLLPFPLNQEARLLNLEVLKASDPDNFPTLFKQSFDAAVGRIATEPSAAYNDLQDLDKLQPGYPGMAAAIKQVRLKLNLDRAAVDPRNLAQARALVTQVSRIIDAATPAQLLTAQTQIRQALALDPTNGDAQVLSDRIGLLLRPTVVTLTPTQVGELNAILDLLRQQRTLEALSSLNDFKARYPQVVNEVRVKDAERRVKAVN